MASGWLAPEVVVGNMSFGGLALSVPTPEPHLVNYLPANIDLANGKFDVIPNPFLDLPFGSGRRNHIVAVLRGPFARVVGTGSCLNVRAEPAGEVLDCAADGVLLRDTGETVELDGANWLRVETPAGLEGWVSTAFLER